MMAFYNAKGPIATYAKTGHELEFESIQTCGQKVTFMSFITSFSQNFNSTWNEESVYGRIDPIATFQGNKRTISVSWEVPAANLTEAKNNIKMFSKLFQ